MPQAQPQLDYKQLEKEKKAAARTENLLVALFLIFLATFAIGGTVFCILYLGDH